MEKKNMVLLTVIAVATLLVAVVGATFAYFTATVQDTRNTEGGDNGTANITAGSVASKTVVGNVSTGAGKFEKTGVYPNHKEIAGLSVQVTNGAGQTGTTNTNIDIVYDVTTNTFAKDEIEVSVYKKEGSEAEAITEDYFGCTHNVQQDGAENEYHFSETCAHEISELTSTAGLTKVTDTPVKLKGASNAEKDLVIASDTISAEGSEGTTTVYYYVVVEFKDTQVSQNDSMNAQLAGKISVKAA